MMHPSPQQLIIHHHWGSYSARKGVKGSVGAISGAPKFVMLHDVYFLFLENMMKLIGKIRRSAENIHRPTQIIFRTFLDFSDGRKAEKKIDYF